MAKNDDLLDLLNEIKLRYQFNQQEIMDSGVDSTFFAADQDTLSADKLNFMLQLRLHETQAVEAFLQQILLKNKTERQIWLTDNQSFLDKFNQLIAKNSHWSLMGLKSSSENSALSLTLAQEVKNTITLINSLFYQESELDG